MQQTKGLPQKNEYKKELCELKIGFIRQGTSLEAFLVKNGIDKRNAHKALVGTWSGVKAKALRQHLIEASRGKK
jgi:hypothetical protein